MTLIQFNVNDTREQMLNELISDDQRVQYDENDIERIEGTANLVTNATMLVIECLAKYRDALSMEVDENTADLVKEARHDLVFAWTMLQTATSKIAWTLRFDGEEAYKRSLKTAGQTMPDLTDL